MINKKTRILLIRHGETDWNVIGRYQGQADPPLNEKGVAQAEKLAEKLVRYPPDRLVSSPLKRAAQTASILAKSLTLPVDFDPRLMEIHQGDWQTRFRSEIEAAYPDLFEQWETDPWLVTPPGGEHLSQVKTRVLSAVDEIVARYPGELVGLVTHRIPIALIKVAYQDLDPNIVRTLHLPNASFEEIDIQMA
jgi:phosphoserine phosphatase